MRRRKYLASAGAATVGLAGCLGLGDSDDDYPSDDVTLIIPFAEGGGTDVAVRNIAPSIAEELGVDIVIENIEGAASLRGTGELFQADPDGYTMGAFNPPSTPISAMIQDFDYDLRELEAIGSYGIDPYTMVANPEYGWESLDDVIDAFEGGEASEVGGQDEGDPVHLMSILIQDWLPWEQYIPYGGAGDIVQAVVAGETPIGFPTSPEVVEFYENDQLDFIAFMADQKTPAFDDYPTIVEEGYDDISFVSNLTRTLWFPPDTDEDIVNTATEALENGLEDEEVQTWAEETGALVEYQGPDETQELLAEIYEEVPEQVDLDQFDT